MNGDTTPFVAPKAPSIESRICCAPVRRSTARPGERSSRRAACAASHDATETNEALRGSLCREALRTTYADASETLSSIFTSEHPRAGDPRYGVDTRNPMSVSRQDTAAKCNKKPNIRQLSCKPVANKHGAHLVESCGLARGRHDEFAQLSPLARSIDARETSRANRKPVLAISPALAYRNVASRARRRPGPPRLTACRLRPRVP
jgi:hypothetical protein